MTENKRFINDVSEILDTYFGYMGTEEPSEREIKEKDYLLIGVARSQRDAESICEKLNEQNEELIEYCNFSLHDVLDKKNKENEQLKKQKARYKRLSEIRNEEINNRILTIKEFIDNCSNEEVKKALKDLFYSEVNEYDLSKKYRKLHEENEDLKEDNAILKQALTRLVEAFNDHISDKSPVRDLIK